MAKAKVTTLNIDLIICIVAILATTMTIFINTSNQVEAIRNDVKDFHGRLCQIEERNRDSGYTNKKVE